MTLNPLKTFLGSGGVWKGNIGTLRMINIFVLTGCLVTRVVIEGGVAKGVEYRQGGQLKFARANKVT